MPRDFTRPPASALKYYAWHIKNMLDASAINVRRDKPNGGGQATISD